MKTRNIGLPPAVVGWVVNHARRNYWRVASWYDLEDLIQDGLMKAYQCRHEYGLGIDAPHFMALVKTAFYNHIGELVRRKRAVDDHQTKLLDCAAYSEGVSSEAAVLEQIMPQTGNTSASEAELMILLDKLQEYFRDPTQLRRALRIKLDGKNETLAERLFSFTQWRVPADVDTELLLAYLWEREHGIV